MPQCVPLIRADQGQLWGSSGLQNRRDQDFPTDLRILGGDGRRRGVVTRIYESKRRRVEVQSMTAGWDRRARVAAADALISVLS